nr:MAG TPA: hypothetical protein [Caudoviricetes sp.]DAZ33974.1 MAG TPA: hypothetical protein [Caudoviricetes sp.]
MPKSVFQIMQNYSLILGFDRSSFRHKMMYLNVQMDF